eukprot:4362993-Amphidinium_carterae.2
MSKAVHECPWVLRFSTYFGWTSSKAQRPLCAACSLFCAYCCENSRRWDRHRTPKCPNRLKKM